MIIFSFTDNYNEEFKNYVDDLFAKTKSNQFGLGDREIRIAAIDDLINCFVEHAGEVPKNGQLDRLSSLILREELTDATPWKVKNTEYSIRSGRQEAEKERNEVGIQGASNYDTSGKDRSYPRRRKRTRAENAYMDRKG